MMVYLYRPTPTPVNISNSGVVWDGGVLTPLATATWTGTRQKEHKWLRFAKRSWETELYAAGVLAAGRNRTAGLIWLRDPRMLLLQWAAPDDELVAATRCPGG
jgi:hypothetical protein